VTWKVVVNDKAALTPTAAPQDPEPTASGELVAHEVASAFNQTAYGRQRLFVQRRFETIHITRTYRVEL
jgi:hypothetical protein